MTTDAKEAMNAADGKSHAPSRRMCAAGAILAGAVCALLLFFPCSRTGGGGGKSPASPSGGAFPREQMAEADEFSRMAKAGDTNLLERVRKWAGGDIQRRIWACDIVRNASLTNELNALARDLAEACVGNDARFARLIRAAQFLEECRDWRTARDTLARAERLAKSPTEREGVSFALLRADLALEGATKERLEALRRISDTALMGFNRREAKHLLEKYGKL